MTFWKNDLLFFPGKKGFDISCILSHEEFAWTIKAFFLGKIRKYCFLLSADFTKRMLKFKMKHLEWLLRLFLLICGIVVCPFWVAVRHITYCWIIDQKSWTISLHLLANSADDTLMIFFLFFLENRIWNIMQIVSSVSYFS